MNACIRGSPGGSQLGAGVTSRRGCTSYARPATVSNSDSEGYPPVVRSATPTGATFASRPHA